MICSVYKHMHQTSLHVFLAIYVSGVICLCPEVGCIPSLLYSRILKFVLRDKPPLICTKQLQATLSSHEERHSLLTEVPQTLMCLQSFAGEGSIP